MEWNLVSPVRSILPASLYHDGLPWVYRVFFVCSKTYFMKELLLLASLGDVEESCDEPAGEEISIVA